MLIDTHKQILVGTSLLGAVPAYSSLTSDGHCYCGEVTGLFIQPMETRDGDKLTNRFCLSGFTPHGQRLNLFIADTMEEVQRVFVAAFNDIMNPQAGSVIYLNIPSIVQQLAQEAAQLKAQAKEAGGVEEPDPHNRVFIPRKGDPGTLVEKGAEVVDLPPGTGEVAEKPEDKSADCSRLIGRPEHKFMGDPQ